MFAHVWSCGNEGVNNCGNVDTMVFGGDALFLGLFLGEIVFCFYDGLGPYLGCLGATCTFKNN